MIIVYVSSISSKERPDYYHEMNRDQIVLISLSTLDFGLSGLFSFNGPEKFPAH
jgi:hypothetical protein